MTDKQTKMKEKQKGILLWQKDLIAQALRTAQGVHGITDISSSTSDERVLTFDCQIEHPLIPAMDLSSLEGDEDEMFEFLEEEWFQKIIPEEMLEEVALEVEGKLQEVCRGAKVQMAYHIYQMGEISEPIHAVFSIAFDSVTKRELDSMARIIAMRQLMGKSKYIH